MTANYIYDFEYISDDRENYFTYTVKNNSIISRFVMDVFGQIKQFTWVEISQEWILFWSQPKGQHGVEAYCGAFGSCNENALPYCSCVRGFREAAPEDWSLGDQTARCKHNTPLQCGGESTGKTNKDKFYEMGDMRLPDNPPALAAASADDCESACLNNCFCTAYSFSSGCTLWYGDLLNLQQLFDGSGSMLYIRLAASELPRSKSKKGMVIGVVVGVIVVLLASFAIVWLLLSRRHTRQLIRKSKALGGTLVAYSYSELQHVTKNFSEKLGGGGFGSVFKGVLPDSTVIAVKKLEGIHQGEKQFHTEVSTIGAVQHVNLVCLLGFCSEGIKRLLVYDYMPKGSLADQLFHKKDAVRDWNTRYQIALGTARGLCQGINLPAREVQRLHHTL